MSFEDLKKPDFEPEVEILPMGYEKNKDGIFKIITKKSKDGDIIQSMPISLNPLTVKSKLYNPDTGEVSYNIEFEGKTVTVPGCDLSQKKGIMQLAGQGLLTTENWAKDLSEYIIKTISISALPEIKIFDSMGWKEKGFVLGNILYTAEGPKKITFSGKEKQAKAVHSSGTLAGWINAITPLMEYDTQRLKVYIAASAPLLKILGESNFSINDYGESSTGKTITTMVGMSMYGHPEDLLFSGGATVTATERTAYQFNDLPFNLDDTQKIKKELLDALIMMIANGVGKLRGAKLGGLQDVLSWRTVAMCTGEAPIINDTTFMGLDARLIEIYGGLNKGDKAAVRTFEQGIKAKHYGTFAPILIEPPRNSTALKRGIPRIMKIFNLS